MTFSITVPRAGVVGNSRDIKNNTCSFEVRGNELAAEHNYVVRCEVNVISVLSRITPQCTKTSK